MTGCLTCIVLLLDHNNVKTSIPPSTAPKAGTHVDDHVVVGHEVFPDLGAEAGSGEVGADADDSRRGNTGNLPDHVAGDFVRLRSHDEDGVRRVLQQLGNQAPEILRMRGEKGEGGNGVRAKMCSILTNAVSLCLPTFQIQY